MRTSSLRTRVLFGRRIPLSLDKRLAMPTFVAEFLKHVFGGAKAIDVTTGSIERDKTQRFERRCGAGGNAVVSYNDGAVIYSAHPIWRQDRDHLRRRCG